MLHGRKAIGWCPCGLARLSSSEVDPLARELPESLLGVLLCRMKYDADDGVVVPIAIVLAVVVLVLVLV